MKNNYDDLTTPELKAYIREALIDVEQAAMELCLRHDSGDLAAFFQSTTFQPKDVRAFILEAKKEECPWLQSRQ